MSFIDSIIVKILSHNPKLTRKEIQEMLEIRKEETGGLIEDEILLRIIAMEFGVDVEKVVISIPSLLVKDLIPNINNITILGRIIGVFPIKILKTFKNKKVRTIIIADHSGILKVSLWDEQTILINFNDIKIGSIIKLSKGYTRGDPSGELELYMGSNSKLVINPEGVDEKRFPTIYDLSTKIREVNFSRNTRLNFIGKIKKIFPIHTFKKKNLSFGKLLRFILEDETGEIIVIIWNKKIDELEKILVEGNLIQIINAKIKTSNNRKKELHVYYDTYLDKL